MATCSLHAGFILFLSWFFYRYLAPQPTIPKAHHGSGMTAESHHRSFPQRPADSLAYQAPVGKFELRSSPSHNFI